MRETVRVKFTVEFIADTLEQGVTELIINGHGSMSDSSPVRIASDICQCIISNVGDMKNQSAKRFSDVHQGMFNSLFIESIQVEQDDFDDCEGEDDITASEKFNFTQRQIDEVEEIFTNMHFFAESLKNPQFNFSCKSSLNESSIRIKKEEE